MSNIDTHILLGKLAGLADIAQRDIESVKHHFENEGFNRNSSTGLLWERLDRTSCKLAEALAEFDKYLKGE